MAIGWQRLGLSTLSKLSDAVLLNGANVGVWCFAGALLFVEFTRKRFLLLSVNFLIERHGKLAVFFVLRRWFVVSRY